VRQRSADLVANISERQNTKRLKRIVLKEETLRQRRVALLTFRVLTLSRQQIGQGCGCLTELIHVALNALVQKSLCLKSQLNFNIICITAVTTFFCPLKELGFSV